MKWLVLIVTVAAFGIGVYAEANAGTNCTTTYIGNTAYTRCN